MWLLTTLLLWVPVGGQVVNATKAVVTLQPPWLSIFQEENVTLLCEGPHLGDSSTKWFINSTAIQISTPTYSILKASFKDSGEYKCQTGLSMPSDPVQLEIYRDWLLLQTSHRVLTEGEPLALRCHPWQNKKVYNVAFYRNGESLDFSQGSEVTILKTNLSHSGIYHCSAMGKKTLQVCRSVCHRESKILEDRSTSSEYHIPRAEREDDGSYWCEVATEDGRVLKRSTKLELFGPQSSDPVWFHILFYLSVGIMFLVNTVLYVKIHRLQREKKYNLEVPLVSEKGKKATSFQQVRSDDVYEEVTATVR